MTYTNQYFETACSHFMQVFNTCYFIFCCLAQNSCFLQPDASLGFLVHPAEHIGVALSWCLSHGPSHFAKLKQSAFEQPF